MKVSTTRTKQGSKILLWLFLTAPLAAQQVQDNSASTASRSESSKPSLAFQKTRPASPTRESIDFFASAVRLHKSGELEAAADLYNRMLTESSRLPEVRNNLAMIYQALGRTDKARREYEEALRIEPSFDVALNNYATLLYALADFSHAQKCWEKATQASPLDSSYWFNLALTYVRTDQGAKAVSALNQVTILNPRHSMAYSVLGVLKRESGDLKGALEAFNQHLILSPDPTSETSAIRTQTADLRVLLGKHLSIPPNQP